jgi:hypothetical protein
MKDHCHHSSLASLTCIQIHGLGGKSVYRSHSLKPLYAVDKLILLKLFLGGRFDLDDTDVKKMALAWPYIQDLILRGHDATEVPLSLMRTCPDSIPCVALSSYMKMPVRNCRTRRCRYRNMCRFNSGVCSTLPTYAYNGQKLTRVGYSFSSNMNCFMNHKYRYWRVE